MNIVYAVISLLVAIWLLRMLGRGAPYVPTHDKVIASMISLLDLKAGDKILDLGSGDGRIVIALAKTGNEVHGFEINPFLVWYSRYRIRKAGLVGNAFIHRIDFWQTDFSPFNAVTIFGALHIMERLEQKLNKELQTGSRVASNAFRLPSWPPIKKESGVSLYIK